MFVLLPFIACNTETHLQQKSEEISDEIVYENHIEVAEDSFLSDLRDAFNEVNKDAEPMIYNETLYTENYSASGMLFETYGTFEDFYFDEENNGCPKISHGFQKISIKGGCVSHENIHYEGHMNYYPYENIETLEFTDFAKNVESELCPEHFDSIILNGGIIFNQMTNRGEVLLRKDIIEYDKSCKKKTVSYWYQSKVAAEFDVEDPDFLSVGIYNGTGTVLQIGDDIRFIDITTIDQKMDLETCWYEPTSGRNIITNGIDTFEFLYDGEKDCDVEATQMLSINGDDTVEVKGSACSKLNNQSGWLVFFLSLLPIWIRQGRR